MKKIIFCLLAFAATIFAVQARNYRFVYIAHDVNTPIELLVQKLEGYYEHLEDEADDEDSKDRTILYLASGSNPVIANMASGKRDDENFNRVISELYERNFHDVDTEVDMETILKILSENDFLTPTGSLDPSIQNLKFEFYVTPNFWEMNQNESLIASLFYSLGMEKIYDPSSQRVQFRIFLPTIEDMRKCNGNDTPFGEKNVNNINTILKDAFIGNYN